MLDAEPMSTAVQFVWKNLRTAALWEMGDSNFSGGIRRKEHMPFRIEQKGDDWCVYNTESGEEVGKHDSRMLAMRQMRALYANEGKPKAEGDDKKKSEAKKKTDGDHDYEDD